MQSVTLLIAVVLSALVLFLPLRMALILYVAGLAWYPTYITMKMGSLDWSIPRFVILAIFLKIMLAAGTRPKFRWITLDYLVIAGSVSAVVAHIVTIPEGGFWEFHAGAQFDTLLVYFMVRLLMTSREEYLTLLKGLLIIAAPLAILGAYQCLTFHNPVGFLKQFHAWAEAQDISQVRSNFCRADVTFAHPIMFGLFFAMVGPCCIGLWHFIKRYSRPFLICGIVLMLVGLISSMSSGPQLAGFGLLVTLIMFPYRRYWKLFLVGLILSMGLVEIGSNRHWYYVASSYLAFNADTAYYRCRLVEHALGGGMSGHWIWGFGFNDPGWWDALSRSERQGTDITNQYILTLVRYGLVGLIPFFAAISAACVRLRKAFVAAADYTDQWMIWCVLASLVGILLAMFSVALSCQPVNLFYMMLGLCGCMPTLVASPALSITCEPRMLSEARLNLASE